MARTPQFVLNYLKEVEALAEDVLADKQQIIDLDKRRNMNREAIRSIKKDVVAPPMSNNKVWMNCGDMFIKFNKTTALDILQADQNVLDKEITKIRNDLHTKVQRLQDAEGKEELKGYHLKSLSKEELNALKY